MGPVRFLVGAWWVGMTKGDKASWEMQQIPSGVLMITWVMTCWATRQRIDRFPTNVVYNNRTVTIIIPTLLCTSTDWRNTMFNNQPQPSDQQSISRLFTLGFKVGPYISPHHTQKLLSQSHRPRAFFMIISTPSLPLRVVYHLRPRSQEPSRQKLSASRGCKIPLLILLPFLCISDLKISIFIPGSD